MKYSLLFLLLLFLFADQKSFAQYYDTGEDPAGTKWLQIKTERFKIIYPEKYGNEGLEFAKALERSQIGVTTLFSKNNFRIPVLIHSFSTQSNGYVAWAPRRMELYPMPDQNSLPGDANTLLAIHELTHVFQLESLNKGFTRALNILIGEQATGVVSSLLPMWLLEGDAVFSETALSSTGRGRSPSFQKMVKALLLEKDKKFRYDKILNGSYRDYVPDKYQTGYQMVTWASVCHGPSLWNNVFDFTGEEPFTINPVNVSLRKNGNMTKKRLYNETFDTLKSIWTRNSTNSSQYDQINPDKKKEYVNYYSPVNAGDYGIAAIKTSLSETSRFVLINRTTGKEKVFHNPGYMYPMLISYGGGKIVWVETRPDPRWENRDYSVIMIHDLKSGTTNRISHRTRYPAAAVSGDGKIVCAIENTVDNINNLVFIDLVTGMVTKTVPSPANAYLQRPQWAGVGKITTIGLTAGGESILAYSVDSGRWDTLKEPSTEDIQSCFMKNDSLFYVSSASGTENIYLQANRNLKQITHSRFGATDPSLLGGKIIFSDYSSQGNSVCYTETAKASAAEETSDTEFLINKVKNKEDITEIEIKKDYNPQLYRKWQHLFRFHSWMPFYADIDKIQSDPLAVRPGITIMSQNTLSSLISTFGYEYTADRRNVLHSKITWKGWYPVFETSLDYGNYPSVYGNPRIIQPGMNLSGTVSLPLRFSTGMFSQYVRPSLTLNYTRDIYQTGDGIFDYEQAKFAGRLFLSNYTRHALRDIYPKWGQTIDLNYRFSPFDKDLFGTSTFIKTAFFFPGIFRNNGIRIRFEKEMQNQSKYIFGNSILFPRGLTSHVLSKNLTSLSADYVFPVAYPDFNISGFLYLKRIRSGLFYDYSTGTGNRYFNPPALHSYREDFRSFGIELLADFHLFRIPFMMSGGIQAAWKDFGHVPNIGILFNIDIYGFSVGGRQL